MTISTNDVSAIADGLTQAERAALLWVPGACRVCLLKKRLGGWGTKPGYRYPTIKLTTLGHRVRRFLLGEPE
jgi:hypothetical protein